MDRIVVGFDGTPASLAATRIAIEEARLRGAAVELVYAWSPMQRPHRMEGPTTELGPVTDDEDERAQAWIADHLAALIDGSLPPVEVSVRVETSDLPWRAVIAGSEGAALIAVGTRGRTGVRGVVLGSVSQQVLAHARCPVLVVPTAVAEDD